MKSHALKTLVAGIAFTAVAASAQVSLKGIGWDGAAVNNGGGMGEATVRLGLGGYNNLEGGLGFTYMESPSNAGSGVEDANSLLSFSVRYLLALHEWEKFTGFLVIGGHFQDDFRGATHANANSFSLMAGYQPEVLLLPHFSVSTRFGLQYTVTPITVVGIVGAPVSIVNGVDFHIIF